MQFDRNVSVLVMFVFHNGIEFCVHRHIVQKSVFLRINASAHNPCDNW